MIEEELKSVSDSVLRNIHALLRNDKISSAAEYAEKNKISGNDFATILSGEYLALAKASKEQRDEKTKKIMKDIHEARLSLINSDYIIKTIESKSRTKDQPSEFEKKMAGNFFEHFNY